MTKPADTTYPVHDLIRNRWSPRAFSSRRVDPEVLARLLEAARWAASCFNEQPWRFVVATTDQPDLHARLAQCLVEANRVWAEKAPVLMLSVACLQFARNAKTNRHAGHDVGLAMGNLSAQATAEGLYLHQMAGFDVERARRELKIPNACEPMAMAAIGYLGDAADLPEGPREKEALPRNRKPLKELVFQGEWDRPWPF